MIARYQPFRSRPSRWTQLKRWQRQQWKPVFRRVNALYDAIRFDRWALWAIVVLAVLAVVQPWGIGQ